MANLICSWEIEMISGRNAGTHATGPRPVPPRRRNHEAGRYRLISLLFAREAVSDQVVTRVHFNASPEVVWNHIMLYEEVPERPPLLLRVLLPCPFRTEGDKTRVGATVRCLYRGGDLVKRITAVEPLHLLEFEVVDQCLGIEDCTRTVGGSYHIYKCGDATDVVLTTYYEAYLRPRYLWHCLEALMMHQLHKHIFRGVCAALIRTDPPIETVVPESLAPQCAPPGGIACTASQSGSRR